MRRARRREDSLPDVLSKVGGLDIAGMTGLFLGGALYHVPIVIDGFISAVAGTARGADSSKCGRICTALPCFGRTGRRDDPGSAAPDPVSDL